MSKDKPKDQTIRIVFKNHNPLTFYRFPGKLFFKKEGVSEIMIVDDEGLKTLEQTGFKFGKRIKEVAVMDDTLEIDIASFNKVRKGKPIDNATRFGKKTVPVPKRH